MTEKEWLASEDTNALYWEVRPRGARYRRTTPRSIMTRRLGSLYGVACLRATRQTAERPFLVAIADAVECAADTGEWDQVDRLAVESSRQLDEAQGVGVRLAPPSAPAWALVAYHLTHHEIDEQARSIPYFLVYALEAENVPVLRKTYADLLRDIAGNPFRGARGRQFDPRKRKRQQEPVFRSEWRTDTVQALARTMYESRDFAGMPILADALQDAGCDNDDILTHCRDTERMHVRGCWVVDLVLGKS